MTTTSGNVPTTIAADKVPGPAQGGWTYHDYARLPEDGHRYEVVDGVLYMTPSPNEWHQTTVGRFFRYLATHIEDSELGRVYMAPFDVELLPGDIVQPDVLVILNEHRERITVSRIIGAPDLVIEVISPGTAAHDRREKQDAYQRAGVREYWLADPASQTVEVLMLQAHTYHSQGVFERDAILPSQVIQHFNIPVKRFF